MSEQIELASLVEKVSRLPQLPEAVSEVMRALNSEVLSANRCIGLIERDQSLAARTLRLANSAFYGAPGRVSSIGDAVRMLGLRTVAGVLTAAAMHSALRADICPGFDFASDWRHAIATGLAARALAPAAGQDADEAFVGGLLHDIGQLVLATFYPEPTSRVLLLARKSDCCVQAAEMATLGFDHARVGALVAGHWRFPAAICQAIAMHHDADVDGTATGVSFAGLLRVADTVAHALNLSGDEFEAVPMLEAGLWQRLNLQTETTLRLFAAVEISTREMSDILQQG